MSVANQLGLNEDAEQRSYYQDLADGHYAVGDLGTIVFVVYTDRLDERRGDLYVALGLAKYLQRLGWGVRLWPGPLWDEPFEGPADLAIVMIEAFIPGLLPPHIATVAWVRNWTEKWMTVPYLSEFDAVWASSRTSADALSGPYGGEVTVVPIGVDAELFHDADSQRDIEVFASANFWGEERELAPALAEVSLTRHVVWVGGGSTSPNTGEIVFPGPISYFAMPRAYAQSTVVIDDVIAPAKRFGNQNSRLFESISAGAIPVSNCALGLAELGLDEVPVYSSGAELTAIVDGLLTDPDATAALSQRLAAVVAERHTFAHRAAQVDGSLRALVEATRGRESRSPSIVWMATERGRINHADFATRIELERVAALGEQIENPPTGYLVRKLLRRIPQLPGRALREVKRVLRKE